WFGEIQAPYVSMLGSLGGMRRPNHFVLNISSFLDFISCAFPIHLPQLFFLLLVATQPLPI
ncbi:MAG: hypothetical protein ACE5FF_18545, partial [Saprospiraceae bacterium]